MNIISVHDNKCNFLESQTARTGVIHSQPPNYYKMGTILPPPRPPDINFRVFINNLNAKCTHGLNRIAPLQPMELIGYNSHFNTGHHYVRPQIQFNRIICSHEPT